MSMLSCRWMGFKSLSLSHVQSYEWNEMRNESYTSEKRAKDCVRKCEWEDIKELVSEAHVMWFASRDLWSPPMSHQCATAVCLQHLRHTSRTAKMRSSRRHQRANVINTPVDPSFCLSSFAVHSSCWRVSGEGDEEELLCWQRGRLQFQFFFLFFAPHIRSFRYSWRISNEIFKYIRLVCYMFMFSNYVAFIGTSPSLSRLVYICWSCKFIDELEVVCRVPQKNMFHPTRITTNWRTSSSHLPGRAADRTEIKYWKMC